jgi:hypothetical protein
MVLGNGLDLIATGQMGTYRYGICIDWDCMACESCCLVVGTGDIRG